MTTTSRTKQTLLSKNNVIKSNTEKFHAHPNTNLTPDVLALAPLVYRASSLSSIDSVLNLYCNVERRITSNVRFFFKIEIEVCMVQT